MDQNGQYQDGSPGDGVADAAPDAENARLAKYWIDEIERCDNRTREWRERCKKIIKRYRDESNYGINAGLAGAANAPVSYPILMANVETTKTAIYARPPKPVVSRRFKDSDPIGRIACEVLERITSAQMDIHSYQTQMLAVRDEFMLTAQGVLWMVYEPAYQTLPVMEMPPGVDPMTGMSTPPQLVDTNGQPVDPGEVNSDLMTGAMSVDRIVEQDVRWERVQWTDFGMGYGRCWDEVTSVWRKLYLRRDELIQQFGEDIGNAVKLDYTPAKPDGSAFDNDAVPGKQACIYEIWDKVTRRVMWVSKSVGDKPLKVINDPLGLEQFFPVPQPILGITGPDTMIPVPDYIYYQGQAAQIDMLTNRISVLGEALRLRGLYDASIKNDLGRLLGPGATNELFPAENFASLSDKGGINGSIYFVDLGMVEKAIAACRITRDGVIQDVYQITGISDIIRGASDPRETAKAQQIKSEWGSLRIKDRQAQFQRFCRDCVRMMCELIAEHWTVESLAAQSAVELPMGVTWEQVLGLIRNQRLRDFRIDVETDSTVTQDQAEDKAARVELLTAMGGFLQQGAALAAANPTLLPLVGEMLTYGVRGFPQARPLEDAIENTVGQLEQQAQEFQQAQELQQQQAMMAQQMPPNVVPIQGGQQNAGPI